MRINLYLVILSTLPLLFGVIASSPVVISPEASGPSQDSPSLYMSGNLICNDITCYPKVFEASNEWKEIKAGQVLPAGLDIKMNLETGLKEAKLGEKPLNSESDESPDFIISDDANSKGLDLVVKEQEDEVEEGREEGKREEGEREEKEYKKDPQSEYEFTKDFDAIRAIIKRAEDTDYTPTALDFDIMETKLEDLMEFAHDYKHGYKIISHEFTLLEGISFNESFPPSIRELSTRMIVSCLRNNPPAAKYVNHSYPEFKSRIFDQLGKLAKKDSLKSVKVLWKRYLCALDELLPSYYIFSQDDLKVLKQGLDVQDKQIKIEVLELFSKLFAQLDGSALEKTNLQSIVPDIQDWAKELESLIQDKDIDELYTRKFFNSLYNIKEVMKNEVKVSPQFLNWLEQQIDLRRQSLNNGLQHRDVEQDSFDEKLIQSRHLVFGNPMAHRIKYFDDEL